MTEMAGVGSGAEILAGDQAPHRRIEKADERHDCANCGTHLQGAYCHACGQKGHLHTRIWHMAEEFVEGVMHFDGRLWRTLPLLAFRPGRLSRAWIEGKRARYVAPLHIFLFSIFLFFLTLSFSGAQLYTGIFEAMARSESAGMTRVLGAPEGGAAAAAVASQRPGIIVGGRSRSCQDPDLEGIPGTICTAVRHIRENPKYYGYKAETTTYKLAPLLAPLSMSILALLLVFKRGYTLYDHGVVALYGLSFVFLLTVAAMLLSKVARLEWPLVVFGLLIAHAVVHLRGAYKLSWVGSTVRTLLLGFMTSTVFSLFLIGIATMSAV
jgi:hypothetical protein